MRLLIDGYNLLHASGILGRAIGPGALERARDRLINQLTQRLSTFELVSTTLVFDARTAPEGAPREYSVQGMRICFASDYVSADEMIVELVRAHSAPESILLVSSDHQVQVAAGRRGARVIDSDAWWDQLQQAPPPTHSPEELLKVAANPNIAVPPLTIPPASPPSQPPLAAPSSASPAPVSAKEKNEPPAEAPASPNKQPGYRSLPPRKFPAPQPKTPAAKEPAKKTPLFSLPKQTTPAPAPPASAPPAPVPPPAPPAKPSAPASSQAAAASEATQRVSSDEVKFWVQQFGQPKAEEKRERRFEPPARSVSEKTVSKTTESPGPESSQSAADAVEPSKDKKTKSVSPKDKTQQAGSAFDFPASYLQAIQDEIDREKS